MSEDLFGGELRKPKPATEPRAKQVAKNVNAPAPKSRNVPRASDPDADDLVRATKLFRAFGLVVAAHRDRTAGGQIDKT